MYIPSVTDPPRTEGKDTAEYKAFRDVSISLTDAIKLTPGAHDALFQRFTQKEWISPTVTSSANDLVVLAHNKIKQRASEYETILKILKEIEGMDIVIENMEGSCYHFLVVHFCLYVIYYLIMYLWDFRYMIGKR